MTENGNSSMPNLESDVSNLYREDVFTDLKAASIRRLTPVNVDGSDDTGREVIYSAHSQVMTPAGALPISAQISAENLGDAFEKFPMAIENELERLRDEVQKQQLANAGRGVNLGNIKPQDDGGIVMP